MTEDSRLKREKLSWYKKNPRKKKRCSKEGIEWNTFVNAMLILLLKNMSRQKIYILIFLSMRWWLSTNCRTDWRYSRHCFTRSAQPWVSRLNDSVMNKRQGNQIQFSPEKSLYSIRTRKKHSNSKKLLLTSPQNAKSSVKCCYHWEKKEKQVRQIIYLWGIFR